MKKILSLALVLCLILSALVSFSSCGSKVSAKDVEKNPQKAMENAFSNTGDKYFPDDAGIDKIVEKAMKLGSMTISFESEDLLGDGVISEKIYMDAENHKYVSDTNASIMGMDLAARIFLDSKGIALSGESILGSNQTLLIDIASFASDFADSDLAQMMGFTDGDSEEFGKAMTALKDGWAKAFAKPNKDTLDFINECYKLLDMETKTEQVEIAEGKTVKCVVVTYKMNNETLDAYYARILEEYLADDNDLKTEIENAFDEMLDALDMNLTYQLCISQKTNEVVKLAVNGAVEVDGQEASMDMALIFGEKEIRMDGKVTIPEQDAVEFSLVLSREEKDGTVTYTLSADGKMGSVSVDLLNATYTYTKSSGDIVLKLDVFNDENTRTEVELKGNLKVTDKSATLVFTSLKAAGQTLNFKLTVAFDVLDQIPALPSDAKDITDISMEEWGEIMTDFQTSPIGQLIFGAAMPY